MCLELINLLAKRFSLPVFLISVNIVSIGHLCNFSFFLVFYTSAALIITLRCMFVVSSLLSLMISISVRNLIKLGLWL